MSTSSLASRRRLVAGGALLAMALVVAVLVQIARPSSGGPDQPTSGQSEAESTYPSSDGAIDTALVLTGSSQQWLYLTDEQLAADVATWAAPETAPSLTEYLLRRVRPARERLTSSTGRIWWLVRPLAWRLVSQAGDTAQVEVWTVGILSADAVAAPQAEWSTLTIQLRHVDRRWLVEDIRDRRGPTPMTGPADTPWEAARLDAALDGFTRIGEEDP